MDPLDAPLRGVHPRRRQHARETTNLLETRELCAANQDMFSGDNEEYGGDALARTSPEANSENVSHRTRSGRRSAEASLEAKPLSPINGRRGIMMVSGGSGRVKKPSGGVFVNGWRALMLVDTGSSLTMLSRDFAKQVPNFPWDDPIEEAPIGVTGHDLEMIATGEVELQFPKGLDKGIVVRMVVHVVNRLPGYDAILGVDFMQKVRKVNFDFKHNVCVMGEGMSQIQLTNQAGSSEKGKSGTVTMVHEGTNVTNEEIKTQTEEISGPTMRIIERKDGELRGCVDYRAQLGRAETEARVSNRGVRRPPTRRGILPILRRWISRRWRRATDCVHLL
ncbi:MAG: retroviral-like aspartic protease [Gammaproteobacteria bacterium]|nr:retroviral-like aspartic protease [Gammaproteobacteria bacterium]